MFKIYQQKDLLTDAGTLIKGGWFLDGSDVSKVEVLVDGKTMGTAQYGSSRLDESGAYYVSSYGPTLVGILSSPSTDSTSTLLTSVTNGSYLKLVMNNGNPFTNNEWYDVYLPNSATTGWVSGANVNK